MNPSAEQESKKSNSGLDSSAGDVVETGLDVAMQWCSDMSSSAIDAVNSCTPAIAEGLANTGQAIADGACATGEIALNCVVKSAEVAGDVAGAVIGGLLDGL